MLKKWHHLSGSSTYFDRVKLRSRALPPGAARVALGSSRKVGHDGVHAILVEPRSTGRLARYMVLLAETSRRENDMSDQKMTMEVPPQVRAFAVKSVDQAERAISSFMESATKSAAMVPSPMNDVAQQTLATTEKNLKASFEHARKLMNAKDINEVIQLQTEFLRKQFGVATEQSKHMTGGIASAEGDVPKEEPDLI
jgi:phasin